MRALNLVCFDGGNFFPWCHVVSCLILVFLLLNLPEVQGRFRYHILDENAIIRLDFKAKYQGHFFDLNYRRNVKNKCLVLLDTVLIMR